MVQLVHQRNSVLSSEAGVFNSGWAFKLDRVAFGIFQIERGADTLCTIVDMKLAHVYGVGLEVGSQSSFIEAINPQADMIHISSVRIRRATAGAAEFSGDGYEVNQGAARAKMVKTKVFTKFLEAAAEYPAIEVHHCIRIDATDHNMVQTDNLHACTIPKPPQEWEPIEAWKMWWISRRAD